MGMWWSQGRADHAKSVVEAVVAAFNARDFTALRAHFSPDFTLIDGLGDTASGRDHVLTLLQRLVTSDPQFTMHVENIASYQDYMLLSGHTTGSHHLCAQRTLWKILVRDGKVAEWRSYSAATPQPFVKLLMKAQKTAMAMLPLKQVH